MHNPERKILHICSNYIGTKIFPNLLRTLNLEYGENYLFCPVKNNSYTQEKYSYLNSNDSIFKENARNAIISKCFTKIDTILFFPKRRKIANKIKKRYDISSFDAIFAHSLFTDGWVANKLFKRFKTPYSVFVQNSDINVFFKLPIIKRFGVKILLNAQKIVFCSSSVKNEVLKNCIPKKFSSIIESKISIIPFGIEDIFLENILSYERKLNLNSEIKILTVGTIDCNKNQLAVAKAIENLRQKEINIKYILVGKVVDEEYMRNLLRYPFVEFLGLRNYEELLKIYRSSDIFALTSKHETFGLVYAEAMTQALPLLYTEGQGFDEQFPQGEVGYAVKCNDVLDISNKLELIIKNYETLSKLAKVNSQRFSWKKVAHDYYLATCEN